MEIRGNDPSAKVYNINRLVGNRTEPIDHCEQLLKCTQVRLLKKLPELRQLSDRLDGVQKPSESICFKAVCAQGNRIY